MASKTIYAKNNTDDNRYMKYLLIFKEIYVDLQVKLFKYLHIAAAKFSDFIITSKYVRKKLCCVRTCKIMHCYFYNYIAQADTRADGIAMKFIINSVWESWKISHFQRWERNHSLHEEFSDFDADNSQIQLIIRTNCDWKMMISLFTVLPNHMFYTPYFTAEL